MTPRTALLLGARALALQAKPLAVDANAYTLYGARYPAAARAVRERERLRQAESVLREMALKSKDEG